jgi:Lysyl oxidase
MRWTIAWSAVATIGIAAIAACRAGRGGLGSDASPPDASADAPAPRPDGPGDDAALLDAAARADAPPPPDAPLPLGDAAGPGVDLVLLPAQMAGSVLITTEYFGPGSCEVAEGCVGAAGNRRLLRFTAVTANQGADDLALGPTPADGVSNDVYVWSPCHHHHHVPGFEDYAIVGPAGVLVTGHKQSYCLRDDQLERSGAPGHGYTCTDQGISAGWADVYASYLACQWVDVTDVPPGLYTLRVTVNPDGKFVETDTTNDVAELTVVL